MDIPRMVEQMCRELLSETDIRAICRSRGFTAEQAASRAIFENFFLSELGLPAALRSLTPEELATLHLLGWQGQQVDVSFFERLAPGTQKSYGYYGTFNQRYSDVHKHVQTALVRRGVLVMGCEVDTGLGKTRLERTHFALPPEFAAFLPPVVPKPRRFEGSGEFRRDVLRAKLLQLTEDSAPAGGAEGYDCYLKAGELHLGDQLFTLARLLEWQQASWQNAIQPHKEAAKTPVVARPPAGSIAPSPVAALVYLLGRLQPGEWAPVEALDLLLGIFCHPDKPSAATLCGAGYDWGYLARLTDGTQTSYRLLNGAPAGAEADPATYLHSQAADGVQVNLQTVPYSVLEKLAIFSRLALDGKRLTAAPDAIKLGRSYATVRTWPLAQWLRQHSPAFHRAFETAEMRWGKHILHEGLYVARVDDPALRVQIERALPDPAALVRLADDFIAFPHGLLPIVERAVLKAGNVIKTVQNDAKEQ